LCGWSMGGLIAYEMARQLRQHGDKVAFLGVMDHGPKSILNPPSPEIARLAVRFEDLAGHEITDANIAAWRRDPAMDRLLPPGLDEAAVHRHLRVYLQNWLALRNYSAPPSGEHLHLFISEDSAKEEDETLGWSSVVRGGVEVYTMPGDHH